MEAVGIAAAALDHPVGVHARRDAYQNAFLNAPQRFNPLPFQVDLKLVVHHVRSQKQSDLPQFRKLPLTGGKIFLHSGASPLQAHFRRSIDHLDLISHFTKLSGIVSLTSLPVIRSTWSRNSSINCKFTDPITEIPLARSCSTSCHRLACALEGGLS